MVNLIDVGQIVNTHGLRGEVKVNPRTDDVYVFEDFEEVFFDDGKSFKVENVRYQKNCVLLKLNGVSDVDEAERMRGKVIYVDRELFSSLPEDTYLVADIIGLRVKDENNDYGEVCDVITTGSNDVYAVRGDNGKFIYIPALKTVVKEISVENGYILVEIPKGLLD